MHDDVINHEHRGMGKNQIVYEHLGAIDTQPVWEMVEDLFEGGKNVFEMQQRRQHEPHQIG